MKDALNEYLVAHHGDTPVWPQNLDQEPEEIQVYHPDHYQIGNGLESQDLIDRVLEGIEGPAAYYLGNILKYYTRCTKKHATPDADLAKANNYAHRLVTGSWRG